MHYYRLGLGFNQLWEVNVKINTRTNNQRSSTAHAYDDSIAIVEEGSKVRAYGGEINNKKGK